MNRCGCCFMVLLFILLVAGDAILFSWFLGQYDTTETSATTTDMIPINKDLSTFWCDGVTLRSSLEFNAFELSSDPIIQDGKFQTHSSRIVRSLSMQESVLHEFYLLRGSSLKASLCASERWAFVSVFKKREDVQKCIDERLSKFADSREDDDFDIEHVACSDTLLTGGVMVESDCEDSDWKWWKDRRKGMDIVNVNAYDSGYYYILLQNFYPHNLNKVQMEINISRTSYDLRESNKKCLGTKTCYLAYNFMSDEKIIAEVLPSKSAKNFIQTTIYSNCDLNELVLICVFLGAPLLLFLILCCASCCLCRSKRQEYREKKVKEVGKEPLLASMDKSYEDDSVFRSNSFNEPPKTYGTNPAFGYGAPPQPAQSQNPSAPNNYYYPPPQYSAAPPYENPPAANPTLPPYPPQQSQEPALPPYKA